MNPTVPLPVQALPDSRAAAARIAHFFETLTPQGLENLDAIYAPGATFKDPFNEVQGLDAITATYRHMFTSLDSPHFIVHHQIVDGQQVFLTWDFRFRFRRGNTQTLQTARGSSHLRLDGDGRITMHRDYWDVAEELYEKLPVLGGLMRWLKRRASS